MSNIIMKKVRLNLARDAEHPNGSAQHGYEFVAPLDAEGHIDAATWREHRKDCRVHRFWQGETDEHGHLIHRPGGSWAFTYDIEGEDDVEAGYRFGQHPFRPGEYVSIKDEDGDLYTFQVVTVEPI
ncbi:hypothetical protein SAMN04515647_2264 [Cohaesibacter sp. ES.047]|uniref:hypothetical protein n=1 Tax=Cohaesibacter sp. ES.047 TaxID=1798205 RepID=UPI000BB93217|nr:hypothetical protein [Cohaesibacter sp. ES.047]SNY92014.1 hypothetical protein SAMN04515647_2264 [Cohaesibacter sp. ES.047]